MHFNYLNLFGFYKQYNYFTYYTEYKPFSKLDSRLNLTGFELVFAVQGAFQKL